MKKLLAVVTALVMACLKVQGAQCTGTGTTTGTASMSLLVVLKESTDSGVTWAERYTTTAGGGSGVYFASPSSVGYFTTTVSSPVTRQFKFEAWRYVAGSAVEKLAQSSIFSVVTGYFTCDYTVNYDVPANTASFTGASWVAVGGTGSVVGAVAMHFDYGMQNQSSRTLEMGVAYWNGTTFIEQEDTTYELLPGEVVISRFTPGGDGSVGNYAVGRFETDALGNRTFVPITLVPTASTTWKPVGVTGTQAITAIDYGYAYNNVKEVSGVGTGTATHNKTTTFTAGAVNVDVLSKLPGWESVSYAASTGTASESTLKTGLSAIHRELQAGNAAAAARAATPATGGSGLSAADSARLEAIKDTLVDFNETMTQEDFDMAAVASSAASSGSSASSATRGQIDSFASVAGGFGGTGTIVSYANTVWALEVAGVVFDLNPFQLPEVGVLAEICRYAVVWGVYLGLTAWAWVETKKFWMGANQVVQASAASNLPGVSSVSAAVMAGVISLAVFAIPTLFFTWWGTQGFGLTLASNPLAGMEGTDSKVWLGRMIWLFSQFMPWAILIGQVTARFLYSLSAASVYALSTSIVRWAVG